MNGLFPIIRRRRRPLIEADVPRGAAGDVVTVQPVATKPSEREVPKPPMPARDAKAADQLDA
jgi:hypothetical protein